MIMKTKTETLRFVKVKATEGNRYLELAFQNEDLVHYDSNLPYEKSREDWRFYSRAIAQILKELGSKKRK